MPQVGDKPYWNMTLKCPKCAAKGMIPWNRLKADKRFYCQRCNRWYRVTGQGTLIPAAAPERKFQISVRSAFSAWIQYHRREIFGRYSVTEMRFWRHLFVTIFVGLCTGGKGTKVAVACGALATCFFVGWLMLRPSAVQAVAPDEPTTIAERAPIFATAWATRHFGTMMKYTIPDQLESLKRWAATLRSPPAYLNDLEFNEITAEVLSVTPQKDSQQALVKVRIMPRSSQGAASGANFVEQLEYWRECNGKWFFSAKESDAALASSAAGSKVPPRLP